MGIVMEILWNIVEAIVQMFLQPFLYIAIILIVFQYRRQVMLERKLFSVKMHALGDQLIRTLLGGLLAGIGISLVSAFTGMTLTMEAILLVWFVALILMLFRVRFLCLAYAVGVLGVLQFIADRFPDWELTGFAGSVLTTLRSLDIPALAALVALLHLAEAILIRLQGAKFASPLFVEGKRGKLVGGYQMQSYWPVPLFLMIPSQTVGSVLPWTPFFGGEAWTNGWMLMAFPVVIGFSEWTQSRLPQEKAKQSSFWLMVYSIVLLGLAFAAGLWSPLMLIAALFAIAMHEWIYWYSTKEEAERSPLYVHDDRGLHILAVIPGTPAQVLGIEPGEIVHKVNGVAVRTKEELHQALRANPAFCKLEVINLAGEIKFLQRAIFAGEHHQLGVILAPDQDASYYVGKGPASIFTIVRMKLAGVHSRMKM
ncbi:PDZ domain-containing protein [Paenibacillus terrigena]|uniref:PDZ domain-containing protein n=1 Tax=Paenibacillus terrigena TaxID=369333 RepID=UPI0028D064EB|nr:PDZ domain-containing protein [Paenibacillus terrigena]